MKPAGRKKIAPALSSSSLPFLPYPTNGSGEEIFSGIRHRQRQKLAQTMPPSATRAPRSLCVHRK